MVTPGYSAWGGLLLSAKHSREIGPARANVNGGLPVPQEVIDAPARMPELYRIAVVAVEQCAKIDECKTWADRMEALSSYARQAHDERMHDYAKRIQARAMLRAGEILKEIEPSKGGPPPNEETRVGADTSLTRTQAATEIGLSHRQRNTALRIASIPPEEFEAAVESDKPPTVTELAERGTDKKPLVDLGDRTAADLIARPRFPSPFRKYRLAFFRCPSSSFGSTEGPDGSAHSSRLFPTYGMVLTVNCLPSPATTLLFVATKPFGGSPPIC
jgi:hypothetical protein